MRDAVMGGLSAMTPEVRRKKSQRIAKHVLGRKAFKEARVVMAYIAMEMEVDPWELVREAWELGKTVAVPRVEPPLDEPRVRYVHDREIRAYELSAALVDDPREHPDVRADVFGILEPKASAREVPPAEIGLVLVPCVAYDRQGYRMGKGGGFYDRFLAREDLHAVSCGLAFAEQLFNGVPRCPHDQRVDMVVTETGPVELEPHSGNPARERSG